MTAIVGFSGSLRSGSYNTMLLDAARQFMPGGVTLEIASIRGIPLYDADWEAEHGLPDIVRDMKEQLANADGLLMATPEYNNSIPGVTKNAIDWLTRPPRDIPRIFGGLPVALMGASTSRGGTGLSQVAWLPILRTLGTRPWFGRTLQVPDAASVFDENGLRDEKTRERVGKFVVSFAEFVMNNRRSGAH
jgi:NAD(P)H-dependent FMN reductase